MGIKDSTCHEEHQVICASAESLNSTPETKKRQGDPMLGGRGELKDIL